MSLRESIHVDKRKIIKPLVSLISLVIILAGALIWWSVSIPRDAVSFNDKTFILSTAFACVGSIIAITSKSRRHYYLFLKKKFANNDVDPMEFEAAEEKRDKHTQIGLSILLAGVAGIALCTILIFV